MRTQIIIDHATRYETTRFICGGCYCPVCSQRVEVSSPLNGGLGVVTSESMCAHVDIAVDAGGLDIAVMFAVPPHPKSGK